MINISLGMEKVFECPDLKMLGVKFNKNDLCLNIFFCALREIWKSQISLMSSVKIILNEGLDISIHYSILNFLNEDLDISIYHVYYSILYFLDISINYSILYFFT